jgi:hypothetical protein
MLLHFLTIVRRRVVQKNETFGSAQARDFAGINELHLELR